MNPICPDHNTAMVVSTYPDRNDPEGRPGFWCKPADGRCSWRANPDGEVWQSNAGQQAPQNRRPAPPQARTPRPAQNVQQGSPQAPQGDDRNRVIAIQTAAHAASRLFAGQGTPEQLCLAADLIYRRLFVPVIEGRMPEVPTPRNEPPEREPF